MDLTWEEAEELANDKAEWRRQWRRRVAQCRMRDELLGLRILPVFLYAAETWTVTSDTAEWDYWCLRQVLNIHWSDRIANSKVGDRTRPLLLSKIVDSWTRLLQDEYRVPPACDWKRRPNCLHQTWLWTLESGERSTTLQPTVCQKNPPCSFQTFFPKRLGIFNNFLYTY